MTGQQLYEMWQEANIRLANCLTDDWTDLTADEQYVWISMAQRLEVKP
jgi:hypothetical protein